MTQRLREFGLFARQVAINPKSIGAVVPSSKILARAMTEGLGPDTGQVVELGPGTGRITRAILEAGVPPDHLHVVELNSEFSNLLRQEFPLIHVHNRGADNLSFLQGFEIDTVISGLPLLNMPMDLQDAIIRAALSILSPQGRILQFTYGYQVPLDPGVITRNGLAWHRRKSIWSNFPPAHIYEFHRA